MEVTPELRQAVYDADCDQLGHLMDIAQAISNNPDEPGENTVRVRAADPELLPHLFCRRCRKVWLVSEQPGYGYDDAVERRNTRVLPEFQRPPRVPVPPRGIPAEPAADPVVEQVADPTVRPPRG